MQLFWECFEIYNEEIYDLMVPENASMNKDGFLTMTRSKLELKERENKKMYIKGTSPQSPY